MPDIQISKWIETFHQYKFDKLTFEPLFKRALLILKDAWLRCIKEDVDRFTTSYYLASSPLHSAREGTEEDEEDEEGEDIEDEDEEQEQSPSAAVVVLPTPRRQFPRVRSGDTQIKFSNDIVYIKRPWLNRFVPSAPSERRERFIEALENAMTDEERKRLRAERLERLRKIEENRKKALKAARERRRKQANEKDSATTATNSDKTVQTRRTISGLYIDRLLPSKNASLTKDVQRLILNNFQRYVRSSKTAPPKVENKLSLTFEIVKVFE